MSTDALEEQILSQVGGSEGGPPKPRRVGGWGDEKGKRRRDTVEEDERFRIPDHFNDDNDDLPVIPDLEAVQEEDLTTQIAAPPLLVVNRLPSYKELEFDLQKHVFSVEGIDLKLLSQVLSSEDEITEEDTEWEWGKLLAEMSSDIQQTWRTATEDSSNHVET